MPSWRELANAIWALAVDAVQQANSGHPGMPMDMADFFTVDNIVKTVEAVVKKDRVPSAACCVCKIGLFFTQHTVLST